MRGKPLAQARHWSAPEVFGSRAYFRTVSDPAQLVIDDIKRHDEGVYRCRVDFRNTQTRSFRYNLTVIGKNIFPVSDKKKAFITLGYVPRKLHNITNNMDIQCYGMNKEMDDIRISDYNDSVSHIVSYLYKL